jgi:glyoxylase-like metal-dependent hydrolase (beta-lactamase superfamily II)
MAMAEDYQITVEIKRIQLQYFFNVNCYLLKNDTGYYLIDTGIRKRRAQVEKELHDAGCRPGDLKLIIITHGHTDHVGNAAYIRENYRAKIAMHKDDVQMVESGDMFIDSHGIIIKLIGSLMKILGFSDYERFTPDIVLDDNQDLSAFGLDATIVHVPGHSKGSLGILTRSGDFFCGDLLVNIDKPGKNTLIDDPVEYVESLDGLKTLMIKTVYHGHGKSFSMEQVMDAS